MHWQTQTLQSQRRQSGTRATGGRVQRLQGSGTHLRLLQHITVPGSSAKVRTWREVLALISCLKQLCAHCSASAVCQ
jgi:hypothetical protein